MRVIAGTARGRPLQGPSSEVTRPTSDLVRGAIFSMLEARGAWFTDVLDLYAGTGALGIEALSRGAERADFIERDRQALTVIATNVQRAGMNGRCRIVPGSLPGALARVRGTYGLIFIDPPYAVHGVDDLFAGLDEQGLLDADSTVVYEHDVHRRPPERCGRLPLALSRAHGSTVVTLYESQGGSEAGDGGA